MDLSGITNQARGCLEREDVVGLVRCIDCATGTLEESENPKAVKGWKQYNAFFFKEASPFFASLRSGNPEKLIALCKEVFRLQKERLQTKGLASMVEILKGQLQEMRREIDFSEILGATLQGKTELVEKRILCYEYQDLLDEVEWYLECRERDTETKNTEQQQ